MKKALAALAVAMAFAAPVSAATIGTIGPANEGLFPLDLPNPLNGVYGEQIFLNIFTNIRVTILGSEAGFNNSFSFGSVTYNTGGNTNAFFDTGLGNNDYLGTGIASWVVSNVATGLLNFSFGVNNNASTVVNGLNPDGSFANSPPNFFASFLPGFNSFGGSSVLLFLDDGGAGPDDNHDDLIVRLDIAPIPVPAAGLMLLLALGGLGAMARRRRNAA